MSFFQDKVVVITGGSDGIGKALIEALIPLGAKIATCGRSHDKLYTLQMEYARVMLHAVACDVSKEDECKKFIESTIETFGRIDVLINNAGVFLPTRTETEDGYETMFQVNYLAPFLLTNLLLRELEKSEQGRIINLSSSVYAIGKFDPDNLQRLRERRFSVLGTYAATKLYMLMFSEELAMRLKDTSITVNAVHPGIVRTRMMLQAPGVLRLVSYLSLPFSVSTSKGAQTSVYLASSPEVTGISGQYFAKSKRVAIKNKFDTPENRALLWDLSLKAAQLGDAIGARGAG